jgi:hypothetical protein
MKNFCRGINSARLGIYNHERQSEGWIDDPAQNTKPHQLQVIVAIILFQTLFFKFAGAEESEYIFASLAAEPGEEQIRRP